MGTRLVVMRNPLFQQTAKVSLAKRDDEMEKLSAHCADEPLAVRICLRGSCRCPQHLEPERQQLLIQRLREDRVAVMDYELVAVVTGKGFTKLLQRPGGSRMTSDIAVQNPPRANFHQHKDVQLPKARSHHDQEITGEHGPGVVTNESLPAL